MVLKQRMEFLLQCPQCKHRMKYATDTIYLENKRKRCVYCNHSFKAREQIVSA